MDDPTEIWIPVPGYEGFYELSNKHRVRSLGRTAEYGRGGFKRVLRSKILKTSLNNGYFVAYLCPPDRKRIARIFYIEAAVARLFPCAGPDLIDPVTGEEWRDILGYPGYQISDRGCVRSLDRFANTKRPGAAKRWSRGISLTVGIGGGGYPKVELSSIGKARTLMVHRLVAEAFVPNPLGLPFVHHRDENKTNARAENLQWVSRAENVQDWFDRRRLTINTATIGLIEAALSEGRSHAEILALLPQRKKKRK